MRENSSPPGGGRTAETLPGGNKVDSGIHHNAAEHHESCKIAHQFNDDGVQTKFALYRYHKLAGDYKEALPYYEKVMHYEDSLLCEKIQQSLVFNQKEYYKQESEKEHNLRRTITALSVMGALLLLAGILLLVQRTREKRKQVEMATVFFAGLPASEPSLTFLQDMSTRILCILCLLRTFASV